MVARRSSIRIYLHEREALVALYLRRRIALEGYENRPEDQQSFVEEWKRLTGRSDAWGELLHYMRCQRKRGLWVRFNGECERSKPPPKLTAEQTEVLVRIYFDHVTCAEAGSDVLGYEPELLGRIAQEFATETGRIVPAHDLNAKLTALRKRGLLTKVGNRGKNKEDHGFNDIDQAARESLRPSDEERA